MCARDPRYVPKEHDTVVFKIAFELMWSRGWSARLVLSIARSRAKHPRFILRTRIFTRRSFL